MAVKFLIGLAAAFFLAGMAEAGFKVGNGDDGVDLEGGTVVEKGPLISARKRALKRLRGLNISGIPGMGAVIPELEKSTIYLAPSDVPASLPEDDGTFHTSMTHQVFARTFAERGAATRVFPAALKLDSEQIEALLIHESLHRALPESVREDEEVVAKLTLAMIAPEASHDRVRDMAENYIPVERVAPPPAPITVTGSQIGYSYRHFMDPKEDAQYRIAGMHSIYSHLYPFGSRNERFGLGLEIGAVQSRSGMQVGPLGISFLWKVLEINGFEFGTWGQASISTLSTEELKSSPFGRDLATLGLSIYKPVGRFYVENLLGYTTPSRSTQTIGAVKYNYEYGGIVEAKIRGGIHIGPVDVGAFAQLHLAEYFRVKSAAFPFDTGRYRIFSVGPELRWKEKDWEWALFGRVLIDSTRNADFDFLGNLMGPGVARGSFGTSVSLMF